MNSKSETHETRKLQITGGSTYIVSLPKKWVTEMALEKGSSLTLVRKPNGTLRITPERLTTASESLEAIIDISPADNPNQVINLERLGSAVNVKHAGG